MALSKAANSGHSSRHSPGDTMLLYGLCCETGFSKKEWKERIRSASLWQMSNYLPGNSRHRSLCSGSTAEGLGMECLGSDVDVMLFLEATVLETGQVPPEETGHIFKLVPTSHPAFVRLQLLQIGNSDLTSALILSNSVADENGRLILKTLKGSAIENIASSFGAATLHGPAITRANAVFSYEVDWVMCIHCKEWPSTAEEWIHRHRPYNWPKPEVIKRIVENGCEVVPVGNRLSATPELEWRLSSSKAEALLVRSFSEIQVQCYFLLKLFRVHFIKPIVPDVICSYHMKTVMLHMVESTDPAEWTKENLTACFMKCLRAFRKYLEKGYLPQYFILAHNLLRPKLDDHTRRRILQLVINLESFGWRFILQCFPLRCPQFSAHHADSMHLTTHEHKVSSERILMQVMSFHCQIESCGKHDYIKYIDSLLSMLKKVSKENGVHADLLKSTIGFSLLSAIRGRNDIHVRHTGPVVEFARKHLEESRHTDLVACQLKHAAFLYHTNEKGRCVQIVNEVLAHVEVLCTNITQISDSSNNTTAIGRIFGNTFQYFTFLLPLSRWELQSLPKPVKEFLEHYRQDLFYILDFRIFAYYLLVVSYSDLRRQEECDRALQDLTDVVQDATRFSNEGDQQTQDLASKVVAEVFPFQNVIELAWGVTDNAEVRHLLSQYSVHLESCQRLVSPLLQSAKGTINQEIAQKFLHYCLQYATDNTSLIDAVLV